MFPPKGIIGWLRLIAIAEGTSYLLFGITMPLKYGLDLHLPNYVVGAAHGGLFLSYGIVALAAIFHYRWTFKTAILTLGASIVPLGTFWMDAKFFKPFQQKLKEEALAS